MGKQDHTPIFLLKNGSIFQNKGVYKNSPPHRRASLRHASRWLAKWRIFLHMACRQNSRATKDGETMARNDESHKSYAMMNQDIVNKNSYKC